LESNSVQNIAKLLAAKCPNAASKSQGVFPSTPLRHDPFHQRQFALSVVLSPVERRWNRRSYSKDNSSLQLARRESERKLKKSVLAFLRWAKNQGLTIRKAAAMLRLKPSRLYSWRRSWRKTRLKICLLGRPIREHQDGKIRNSVFEILHSPPAIFNINRTTWKQDFKDRWLQMAKGESRSDQQ